MHVKMKEIPTRVKSEPRTHSEALQPRHKPAQAADNAELEDECEDAVDKLDTMEAAETDGATAAENDSGGSDAEVRHDDDLDDIAPAEVTAHISVEAYANSNRMQDEMSRREEASRYARVERGQRGQREGNGQSNEADLEGQLRRGRRKAKLPHDYKKMHKAGLMAQRANGTPVGTTNCYPDSLASPTATTAPTRPTTSTNPITVGAPCFHAASYTTILTNNPLSDDTSINDGLTPTAPKFDATALCQLSGRLEPLVSTLLTQYGIKRGLRDFGSDGDAAMEQEMRRLHEFGVLAPKQPGTLTASEKNNALQYFMFLKRKRDSCIMGRVCAEGRKQTASTHRDEVSSPTIATESLFLILVIAAKKRRDVLIKDVPGAFLQTTLVGECVQVQ